MALIDNPRHQRFTKKIKQQKQYQNIMNFRKAIRIPKYSDFSQSNKLISKQKPIQPTER